MIHDNKSVIENFFYDAIVIFTTEIIIFLIEIIILLNEIIIFLIEIIIFISEIITFINEINFFMTEIIIFTIRFMIFEMRIYARKFGRKIVMYNIFFIKTKFTIIQNAMKNKSYTYISIYLYKYLRINNMISDKRRETNNSKKIPGVSATNHQIEINNVT